MAEGLALKIEAFLGRRAFLFLQGPPGPLAFQLGQAMRQRGVEIHRINICAGDQIDWPEQATNYRGRFEDWAIFVDSFLREHRITDVLLFGDCRPYHVAARRIASLRGISTHVLEEGYLRPHWMTLELEGVNAYSPLRRDKEWFIEQARHLRPEPESPPITASFRRRVRDAAWHYSASFLGAFAFPHYRSHRSASFVSEMMGWSWRFLVRGSHDRAAGRVIRRLRYEKVFLLPLQLSGDYQIRNHSPFPDMPAATAFVLESFAAHAPGDVHLLIKKHPLDCSFFDWSSFIAGRASKLGIADRVHYIDGGDLERLVNKIAGMVCVNSTSATLALQAGKPVCALGDAVYKMPGLTYSHHIDQFWTNPVPPEPGLYETFRRTLVDRSLVRGGLASESAVATLVENMVERLTSTALPYSVSSQAFTPAK